KRDDLKNRFAHFLLAPFRGAFVFCDCAIGLVSSAPISIRFRGYPMIWSYLRLFRKSKNAGESAPLSYPWSGSGDDRANRRPLRRLTLAIEELESRTVPSVNVLTFHNDIASTGLNAQETQLTPANVRVNSFGKLSATTLDGQVYAEPLVDTGVTI